HFLQISSRNSKTNLYNQRHRELSSTASKSYKGKSHVPHRRCPSKDAISRNHGCLTKVDGTSPELWPDFLAAVSFLPGSSPAVHPLPNERLHPRRDYLSLHRRVKGSLRLTPLTLLAPKKMSQLG